LQVLDILGKKFGFETNSKGKKVLPRYLRVLQGDGISYETLKCVLDGLDKAGWSTENMVFGSGGALLQKVDRDTQKCAFKCSFAVVDGKPVTVFYVFVVVVHHIVHHVMLSGTYDALKICCFGWLIP